VTRDARPWTGTPRPPWSSHALPLPRVSSTLGLLSRRMPPWSTRGWGRLSCTSCASRPLRRRHASPGDQHQGNAQTGQESPAGPRKGGSLRARGSVDPHPPRAGPSGSSGRWQRPFHVRILQRLACTNAPRPTTPASLGLCVPRSLWGSTRRWMWLGGPEASQGAEVGQRAAHRRLMPLVALAVFRRAHVPMHGAQRASPLITAAATNDASDERHRPLSLALVQRCDACWCPGSPSTSTAEGGGMCAQSGPRRVSGHGCRPSAQRARRGIRAT